jgi:hypothetical protein
MEPFPFRRHSLRIVTFVSGLQFFDSLNLANRYLEGICLVWISNGTALVVGGGLFALMRFDATPQKHVQLRISSEFPCPNFPAACFEIEKPSAPKIVHGTRRD